MLLQMGEKFDEPLADYDDDDDAVKGECRLIMTDIGYCANTTDLS